MYATYLALQKHGYADLTMQDIADEFDKTKAVIHYHYDTKQNLLVAFLEYLLERFDRNLDITEYPTAYEQVLVLLDGLLGHDTNTDDDGFDHEGITIALLQLRAQAVYNDEFSRQLTVNAETIQSLLATVIQDGIDQGIFRSVDPDRTATTLLACTTGARNYGVTLEQEGIEADVRTTLHRIVDEWLCCPEAT